MTIVKRIFATYYREASSPKARSVLSMALASAVHFAGYEYARTGTLTLLTSERTGFSSSSVVPLAMGCASPVSLLLLWLYASMLERSGPSASLRNSLLFYAFVLISGGLFLQSVDHLLKLQGIHHQISSYFLFGLFVLENCFVQLLFTQQWAFMSSVQTKEEAAVWFAPIAGIGSIISTVAAFTVSHTTDTLGLPSLLIIAGVFMLLSTYFSMDAYRIAAQNGFEPAPNANEKKQLAKNDGKNLLQRAVALFQRVPILEALCIEALISQSQSSLLNSLFVLKMKETIPSDDERARYTGNCYAGINSFSGVLHFAVLPVLGKRLSNQQLWLIMPTVVMLCTVLMSYQNAGSIHVVSASFLLMKAMEYSIRGVTTEMVYVSLDYESRFLGKEIIGVFVNRVGKSAVAIGLSVVTTYYGSDLDLKHLSTALVVISILSWLLSYRLSKFLDKTNNNDDDDDNNKSANNQNATSESDKAKME